MTCEKCWNDAYSRSLSDTSKSQAEHYMDLLEERKDKPCNLTTMTPEQKPQKRIKTENELVYFIEHNETHEWWAGHSYLNDKDIWTNDPLRAWPFEDIGSAKLRAWSYELDKITTVTEHIFMDNQQQKS